jgi:hypothetical protein
VTDVCPYCGAEDPGVVSDIVGRGPGRASALVRYCAECETCLDVWPLDEDGPDAPDRLDDV